MATFLQFEKRAKRTPELGSPLTPELMEFIDRAIVPVLVKEYLALADEENKHKIVADEPHHAAHSVGDSIRSTAPALRSVRP